jgi:hypothetical protein
MLAIASVLDLIEAEAEEPDARSFETSRARGRRLSWWVSRVLGRPRLTRGAADAQAG